MKRDHEQVEKDIEHASDWLTEDCCKAPYERVANLARLGAALLEVHRRWQSGEYFHTQIYFADEVERVIAEYQTKLT